MQIEFLPAAAGRPDRGAKEPDVVTSAKTSGDAQPCSYGQPTSTLRYDFKATRGITHASYRRANQRGYAARSSIRRRPGAKVSVALVLMKDNNQEKAPDRKHADRKKPPHSCPSSCQACSDKRRYPKNSCERSGKTSRDEQEYAQNCRQARPIHNRMLHNSDRCSAHCGALPQEEATVTLKCKARRFRSWNLRADRCTL